MVSGIIGRDLMKVVLVLQALAAICIGLMVFGVDVLSMISSNPMVLRAIQAVFGVCGVLGLLEVLMGCDSCCD